MKKILFPTDFSKTSLNAFIYALHLADKINAEIITLHVYELPVPSAVENYDFILETYRVTEWSEFENYKGEVPKLRKIAEKNNLSHIKISHILESGNSVTEILNIAKKEKPDFIIIGTKGATGLKEVFMGTVAEKIINQSNVPVIAVPENCQYNLLKKMLFITELEKLEMDVLAEIRKIAIVFKAKIEVLQIKPEREEDDKIVLSKWTNKFHDKDINFTVLHNDDTEKTILDFISLNDINLTVIVVRHKSFFQKLFLWSLARNMAYHTQNPLLCIPSV